MQETDSTFCAMLTVQFQVNRAIFVKNLPFKITADELYDIFGKYGALRQVRLGNKPETRGKAYIVFEDIYDAKNAVDHLSGFNVGGRYIIVLYHNNKRQELVKQQKLDTKRKQEVRTLTHHPNRLFE